MADGEVTPSSMAIDKSAAMNNGKFTMKDFKSIIKIGIVNSNLFTVFAGFWLALHFMQSSFMENIGLFIVTMLGSALVLIGASVLNNWYDVDIDPVMSRTKERPTVTGKLSLNSVLFLGVVSTLSGLILLYFTTVTAAIVAFIGWFTYVVLYTMWSKRRFTLNTEIGCISGAVPPLIGWSAVNPDLFHIVPVVLFLIMFIWQTPHFLALAMKNCKEYKAAGVPMLPAVHGFEFTKRQIVVYIACLLPLPFFLGELGLIFLIVATTLNVVWLIIGFSGFFMKNVLKWANIVFFYSLGYLIIIFFTMIIAAV